MQPVSFIYSGFYYFFREAGLSTRPDFSAWAACTLAAISYLAAILSIVGKVYTDNLDGRDFPFGIVGVAIGIAIAWLSDWEINNTWFGATVVEMQGNQKNLAKVVSITVLLMGWVTFTAVNRILYT